MKSKKGPVILIAAVFLMLIAAPIVILFGPGFSGQGGGSVSPTPSGSRGPSFQAEGDVGRLGERARHLVQDRLADAARRGDIGIERMRQYSRDLERAQDALSRGREDLAKERFSALIAEAEADLERFEAAELASAEEKRVAERLRSLEPLKSRFRSTFEAAERAYRDGWSALSRSDYSAAVESFAGANALLDEVTQSGEAEVEALVAMGDEALGRYDLATAQRAFRDALEIDSANAAATAGLETVDALRGIENEVREIDRLIEADELDRAKEALDTLLSNHFGNRLLEEKRTSLSRAIRDRDLKQFVAQADAAEARGDLDGAITALEAAINIRAESALVERLRGLVNQRDARRLEDALERGYAALVAARYAEARDLYRVALELDSNSAEARQGLERSARLLVAEIEFRENLESAHRMATEGRYPMAASFFNRAMASRPSNLPETARETELRRTLEIQSRQVTVTLRSDNRTFVSIIGVLPPEQFRTKELSLFPDVYRVRGTRRGSPDVEMELRVNAETGATEITVIANGR